MSRRHWSIVVLLVAGSIANPSFPAGQVDIYDFAAAEDETRYRTLIDEFRCPKCLNTNLSGSDAPIAKDLRGTVYRLIVEEDYSDQEIRDFLQARYGDFVLYNPPFKPGTWLLWLAPVFFSVLGLWVLFRVLRPSTPVSLSAEDQARLRDILKGS